MHATNPKSIKYISAAVLAALLAAFLITQDRPAQAQGSPLHPTFPLLDDDGQNVLESGRPVSTMQTCGACHDTAFISDHSFHADVGLEAFGETGQTASGRAWDSSPGIFGRWNPLTYRLLSPEGDERIDLTTADWIRQFGARHVGGGPAETSRDGRPLAELGLDPSLVDGQIVDPQSGELVPWDWAESGIVEMNCFLCHTAAPNNAARIETLQAGQFGWANSATLLGSGLLEKSPGGWQWQPEAFDENGELNQEILPIQDPTNENCSQCHGLVHIDLQTPLTLSSCQPDQWSTITTGQIVSPQRLSESGLNLDDKETLARSWDVHAERVVGCTDCHYSLNNPVYYEESADSRPEHLIFDPRRIDLGEYLYRPLHQFAKGQSAQGTVAPDLDNTLRRCESCHSIEATHDWLPYKERHTEALSCETCHVPKLYAPARQFMDWTVLKSDGTPQTGCRGIEGSGQKLDEALIHGYEPALLPRDNGDGATTLAPHNLVTSWFWVYGDPERPAPLRDLQAAWLDDDGYHPEILAEFDKNNDGRLDETELVLDSDQKVDLIAGRLAALGLENPRIKGEIQPYTINHDVAEGQWATRECSDCHSEDSRITQAIALSNRTPGGVLPAFVQDNSVALGGEVVEDDAGGLLFRPAVGEADLYILGHNKVNLIDTFGALLFLGVIGGVTLHGGLRFFSARRRPPADPELQEVYMYGVYERLWHWLQTVVILILIFTGLIIHKPDTFGIFSFRFVVEIHNIMAFLLVANAALALFYHLASGEIRQFLPRPHGFFDQAIVQAKFYLQGIFRGEEHPYEKSRRRKLNPLQQATYFGLLNVLLPLQILTGLLMWGRQLWPDVAMQLGGLTYLAPFHTLISWLLASFVVMHVYLTTTGPSVDTSIKAMINGWDQVEVHSTD